MTEEDVHRLFHNPLPWILSHNDNHHTARIMGWEVTTEINAANQKKKYKSLEYWMNRLFNLEIKAKQYHWRRGDEIISKEDWLKEKDTVLSICFAVLLDKIYVRQIKLHPKETNFRFEQNTYENSWPNRPTGMFFQVGDVFNHPSNRIAWLNHMGLPEGDVVYYNFYTFIDYHWTPTAREGLIEVILKNFNLPFHGLSSESYERTLKMFVRRELKKSNPAHGPKERRKEFLQITSFKRKKGLPTNLVFSAYTKQEILKIVDEKFACRRPFDREIYIKYLRNRRPVHSPTQLEILNDVIRWLHQHKNKKKDKK